MDDYVKNKLKEWNLEKLVPLFEAQEIDEQSFACLDKETLLLTIPKAGPRALFLKKWESEFTDDKENSSRNANNFPVLNLNLSQPEDPNTLFCISPEGSGTSANDVGTFQLVDENEVSQTNQSISWIDNIDLTIELCAPTTDLLALLKDTIEGKTVLSYYIIHRSLNELYRVSLADCIVTREMKTNYDHLISPERSDELSSMIIELFPTEIKSTYYLPYSNRAGKRTNAKGKLYLRYNHFRERLLISGAAQSKRGIKRKAKEVDDSVPVRIGTASEIFENVSIDSAAVSCEDKLAWLKEHIDPWSTVEEFWRKTSKTRLQNLVLNLNFSSVDYINSVPALTHVKNGLKLIGIDFECIYPHKVANLANSYDDLEKKILYYCSKKQRVSKEIKALTPLLTASKDKDNDIRSAITFRLLPLLLPNPASITSPNGTWHVRKDQVQNHFLLHARDENDLYAKLVERKTTLIKYGLTEQPLPVIIGSDLTSIVKRLVIINDIRYEADSNLECIDYCFKSFFALQLMYSKYCSNPWLFLQKAIYKISSEDPKVIPALDTFIRDLNLS